MRLTCPNCGAQYEVPDEVIPQSGRDVQCSNCGDTWFQHHPDHEPAEELTENEEAQPEWDSPDEAPDDVEHAAEDDVADISDDDASGVDERDAEEPEAEEPDAPEDDLPQDVQDDASDELEDTISDMMSDDAQDQEEEPEQTHEDVAEDTTLEEDAAAEPEDDAAEDQPQPRGLDPAIANLLREEATREEEARAAESGGLETQPDLGLDDAADNADERSEQVKSRMARLRGLPEDGAPPEDEPDPSLVSRRNLLPDIDEINSSLDSETTRAEDGEPAVGEAAAAVRRGGFKRGFMRGVLLVVLLVLIYLLAPVITENVPALAGVMDSYVSMVDAGRARLKDMIGGLLTGG